jgi:hypothetical protein
MALLKVRNENNLPTISDCLNQEGKLLSQIQQAIEGHNPRMIFSRIIFWKMYIVVHPDTVKELMKHDEHLPKKSLPYLKRDLNLLAAGLATSNGDLWR